MLVLLRQLLKFRQLPLPSTADLQSSSEKSRRSAWGRRMSFFWRLDEMTSKVENLESELKSLKVAHSKELDELNSLHEKRVSGLLATISSPEEHIMALESSPPKKPESSSLEK